MNEKNSKRRYTVPFIVIAAVAVLALIPLKSSTTFSELEVSHADTAWMLMAAALVFLMTPGLAFFYGGMVRSTRTLFQRLLFKVVITIGIH
jgi:Amt family ammonium transporter